MQNSIPHIQYNPNETDPARIRAYYEYISLIRAIKIEEAKSSFWIYCQLRAPKFYTNDKPFLREICDTLQALFEKRLFKDGIVTADESRRRIAAGEEPIRKLMLNMPPRFGKTRTGSLFSEWVFGRDHLQSIIAVSYNEKMSGGFSRATRNGIKETKIEPEAIVFSDIFPNTRIKHGDSAVQQWTLEGSHFSYLGTSFKATITGIGAKIGIIDDTIKQHEEALNVQLLESQLEWYDNTFLSRLEQDDDVIEAMQIIFMTRWSKMDLCGRLLIREPEEWFVLKYEAYYEATDTVLHERTLSKKLYLKRRRKVDSGNSMVAKMIFMANYHQETIDSENQVYQNLKEWYVKIDRGRWTLFAGGVPIVSKPSEQIENGYDDLFEDIMSYCDTADEGTDWLCQIPFGVIKGQGFVLDPYCTDKQMEITEIETAENIYVNNVRKARIERNNGARSFGRNVKRLLWENHKSRRTEFEYLWQKKNKEARILSHSSFVINNIFFPEGWRERYPDFYQYITGYMKGGKNQIDDPADALTGCAEMLQELYPQEIEYDEKELKAVAEVKARNMRNASRI